MLLGQKEKQKHFSLSKNISQENAKLIPWDGGEKNFFYTFWPFGFGLRQINFVFVNSTIQSEREMIESSDSFFMPQLVAFKNFLLTDGVGLITLEENSDSSFV